MAKINYSKVEDAFSEGLHKMNVNELDKIAEVAQSIGQPELRGLAEEAIVAATQRNLQNKATLHVLRKGAKRLTKDDFYTEFDLTYESFTALIEKGRELRNKDWEKLLLIKAKMLALKEKQIAANPDLANESVIESTRKKQTTARINVNKNWVPLK